MLRFQGQSASASSGRMIDSLQKAVGMKYSTWPWLRVLKRRRAASIFLPKSHQTDSTGRNINHSAVTTTPGHKLAVTDQNKSRPTCSIVITSHTLESWGLSQWTMNNALEIIDRLWPRQPWTDMVSFWRLNIYVLSICLTGDHRVLLFDILFISLHLVHKWGKSAPAPRWHSKPTISHRSVNRAHVAQQLWENKQMWHEALHSRTPLPPPCPALKQADWMGVIYNALSLSIVARWYEVNQGRSNERLRIYSCKHILSVVSVTVALPEDPEMRLGGWRAIKQQQGSC